ncbi:hypothetical protein FVEG_14746 [Fusarium verticillioides 7600]|uniref:Cytochrome c oxidase assembly factor 3 n=1 Tax=Gibberella moniliformis (strain M3125 / FGSC 7600) TaxID=334819 RepID=W7LX28_GIBM7|nr:hypothetical protein FVEG_14746 [Fusarium verticillioides 7600]EWG37097.1 hypothetical protein FVEG_14746 [Fusarium verticillioides 7600]
MPTSPHSTYYDRRLRQGPALVRARRPYLVKNAVTGLGLLAVVGSICTHRERERERALVIVILC